MIEVTTINFNDVDKSQQASVIVRQGGGRVALALSLASDGDVEVLMARDVATRLAQALLQAAA
jgi:hypothetical protein